MTDISQGPTDKRRVPAWVGVVLVICCLAAGGAFIWWVVRSPMAGGADFIPDPQGLAAVRPHGGFQRAKAQSIRKTSDNNGGTYQVQTNGIIMDVELRSGNPRYTFRYLRKDLIPKEETDILLMKYRIMGDTATAQLIGLTDAQRQKLSKISIRVTTLDLAQAQRDKLASLWQEYYTAKDNKTKLQAEKTLIETLKKTGQDGLAATRKKATERVDQIKAILSADQIKKFQAMSNGP